MKMSWISHLGAKYRNKTKRNVSDAACEKLCIDEQLIKSDADFEDSANLLKLGYQKICGDPYELIPLVLKQVSKKNSRKKDLKQEFIHGEKFKRQATPVSAHKILRPTFKTESELEDSNRRHFTLMLIKENLDPVREHIRGLEITTQGLHMLYTGLYYIYSSISFKSTSASTGETQQLFIHRISHNQPWNSGVLLRSMYTPCATCSLLQESSFTGGIFHLQQGDLIQLCLSSPDNVHFDNSSSSYVGLFMLTSKDP